MSKGRIIIASDHRGFALKGKIAAALQEQGWTVTDMGPSHDGRCDASDYAHAVAQAMKGGEGETPAPPLSPPLGILICGSGQAMAITANRYPFIRAALCTNSSMARLSREHNDANILVLGADTVGEGLAMDCVTTFLSTAFLGGRYADRLGKLTPLSC